MDQEKINAYLTLEKANKLPPEHAKALATLRSAGMVPPLEGQVPFQPKAFDKGGFVDRNLLSGQIPQVATGITSLITGKNPVTSPLPVGLVGAGAENLESIGRVLSGLDSPPEKFLDPTIKAGKDFLKHATYEAAGGATVPFIKAAAGAVKDLAKGAGNLTYKMATSGVPIASGIREFAEDRMKKKAVKGIAELGSKYGTTDVLQAGRGVVSKGDDIMAGASKKYLDLKGAMRNKFGQANVSAETLRKAIDKELKSITEFVADFDPEMKRMKPVLEKWQQKLVSNPTLGDLDDITTALFELKEKNVSNPAFGRLFAASRQNLLSQMDDAAVALGKKAPDYKQAVKASKEALETSTQAQKEAAALKKSKSMFPVFMGDDAEKIAQRQAQADIKFKNVEEIINALDSENQQVGDAARKAYTSAREEISKNLAVKEGPFGKLIEHGKQFPSEVSERARSLGRLDLPEVVDEAISVNPEYRGVARQAVLTDIFSRGQDPKTLQKSIAQFKNVLPKLLDESELDELFKAAGMPTKGMVPPWLKGDIAEGAIRLAPTAIRAAVPFINRQ